MLEVRSRRHQPTLIDDILLGAVKGDFAQDMGGAGRLTQVVMGFMPGISTLCAMRDMIADWRADDKIGAALNGLAMIPLVGGISKMAAVLRATRRMSKALRAARVLTSPVPAQNPSIKNSPLP